MPRDPLIERASSTPTASRPYPHAEQPKHARAREGNADPEQSGAIAVHETVFAGGDRGAPHQAVGSKDVRRSSADRQLLTGVIDVRQDDHARPLEVDLE